MLFNSYEFIFIFLPFVFIIYLWLVHRDLHNSSIAWLVAASLFFYGWWNPPYLFLLFPSVIFNFLIGSRLAKGMKGEGKPLLFFGIGANLALIGYFKYAHFFLEIVTPLASTDYHLEKIILPLAISFFTFQQITFLVDSYRGLTREYKFLNYCLFVTFFPQLIAGPIVHHSEMMPQFAKLPQYNRKWDHMVVGLVIFAIGLAKKTLFADGIAGYATPVFAAAETGETLNFLQAWGAALSYTFQLYFDFSGYSDMAIGAARLFGVRLPMNFNSPYKAANIIEFWKCWHMTLSRFLRDYIYIPLGGNRNGQARRYVNLMTTMLLGGLWHGAGWSFVIWGGMHGIYLTVNHGWLRFKRFYRHGTIRRESWLGRRTAQTVTFLVVVVGWVFFRAATLEGAWTMLKAMAGENGVSLPQAVFWRIGSVGDVFAGWGIVATPGGGNVFLETWSWIAGLFVIVLFAPNTQEIMRRFNPVLEKVSSRPGLMSQLGWQPNLVWNGITAVMLAGGILALSQVSEFLYFQF